jgi:uncharacterized protein with PQ loop repeat
MNIGLHHIVKEYRSRDFVSYLKNTTWFKAFIDRIIYVVGIFSVCVLIPQLSTILTTKSAEGVSILTWIGFFTSSSFWLAYGLLHKEKPIIITNIGAMILDATIIVAILLYK